MKQGYLDELEETLASGAALLGRGFAGKRVRYVRSKQTSDGGFVGRAGGSDIYYTDFALRALTLLEPDGELPAGVPEHLQRLQDAPRDAVECFNRLNCARLLAKRGIAVHIDTRAVRAALAESKTGPYGAFLSALCHEMLGSELPDAEDAVNCVAAACCAGGGFSGLPGTQVAQTNATAAAVGFLKMRGALDEGCGRSAAEFIVSMQTADGGFLAHKAAPEPDLLSTFTALVTLGALRSLDRADLAMAGRFVRSLAAEDGGFRSATSDPETDLEYTYYGAATAALLRSYVARHGK